MDDIKRWLTNPDDFLAGIKLFEKYNGNSFYVKLFKAQGATEFNKNKLRSELQSIVPDQITVAAPIIIEQPIRTNNVQKPVTNNDQVTYLRLLKQRDDTYRQLDHNNTALDLSTDQDVLYETALKMKSLWVKLQEIWTKIDFYKENGYFPQPEPEKEVVTPEIQRLYVSIHKAEKRLQKPDCRNKYKTEELLKQKRERLQQLKENG